MQLNPIKYFFCFIASGEGCYFILLMNIQFTPLSFFLTASSSSLSTNQKCITPHGKLKYKILLQETIPKLMPL